MKTTCENIYYSFLIEFDLKYCQCVTAIWHVLLWSKDALPLSEPHFGQKAGEQAEKEKKEDDEEKEEKKD